MAAAEPTSDVHRQARRDRATGIQLRLSKVHSWPVYVTAEPPKLVEVGQKEVRNVLNALADERWAFRTVEGIARDTGLTEDVVSAVLSGAEGARPAMFEQRDRATLWTITSRPAGWRERYIALKRRIATW